MFRRLFREYLSLTRGERRGLQVLSFLVILLVLLRSFMPRIVQPPAPDFTLTGKDFAVFLDSLQTLDELAAGISGFPAERDGYPTGREKFPASKNDCPAELFFFDPNTADLDDLIRLGIPCRTASILINYRQAGGSFARDSDLLRVYGLTPGIYDRLQAYIRIHPAEGEQYSPAVSQVHGEMADSSAGRKVSFFRKSIDPFELNRADTGQLIEVYGIGPVFARRIIKYRDLLGGFYRQEQLMEVYGFSPQQYEELSRCSFIDTGLLRKIDLNRMDAAGLSEHPYIDRYQANALVLYREQAGSFLHADQVLEIQLLPDSVFRRILPYLHAGR